MRLVMKLLPCAALFAMATVASADVWDEIADGGGDAGDFPAGGFQTQAGPTIYDVITGNNADGIDSYKITITDASNFFLVDTSPADGSDTKAFLWRLDGSPVMANDDEPGNPGGDFNFGFGDQNTHTGNIIGNPGKVQDGDQYILSIGAFLDEAQDAGNNRMFIDDGGDFGALTGPTGAGPFDHWASAGAGNYEVQLFGAQFGKSDQGGIVHPDSYVPFRGFLNVEASDTGTVADVQSSDDLYLCHNPGITIFAAEAPVTLDFTGTLPNDSPATLDVTIESSANTVGLGLTFSFWNFNTNSWDIVGTVGHSLNADAVNTFAGVPADHVQAGTGVVMSRYEVRVVGIIFLFPWLDCVDEVFWTHG